MKTWKTPQLKNLSQVLVDIDSQKIMLALLRDLCTLEELEVLARRWEAAQLIDQNIPYRTIAARTGLSTATVTRIAHWLHYGQGGYRAVIQQANNSILTVQNTKKKIT